MVREGQCQLQYQQNSMIDGIYSRVTGYNNKRTGYWTHHPKDPEANNRNLLIGVGQNQEKKKPQGRSSAS